MRNVIAIDKIVLVSLPMFRDVPQVLSVHPARKVSIVIKAFVEYVEVGTNVSTCFA